MPGKPTKKSTKSVKRDHVTLELQGLDAFEPGPDAGDLSTIEQVNLVECSFGALPTSLAELPAVTRLVMNDCSSVTELPDRLVDKLVMLSIERCPIRALPPMPDKLETLSLISTAIASFPNLANNRNLTSLHVEDATLTSVPDLSGLTSLEKLTIAKCPNLTELPSSLCRLPMLSELEVYDTGLATLPERIGDLKPLKRLVLGSWGSNKLTSLPDSICDLENLNLLWLANNELEILPARTGALKSLMMLTVEKNKLASLPDSIFELKPFCLSQEFSFGDNPMSPALVKEYKARIKAIQKADQAARKAAREAAPSS